VISLKKHIEEAPDLLKSLTLAYRSALAAISRAASQPAPQLGPSLQGHLDALGSKLSVETVGEIDRRVVQELEDWGQRSAGYFREKAAEVKEILLLVTHTAQVAGEKDERYISQLSAFSGRLKDIGTLEDLTRVRQSLSQSALDLKSCVDRMAADGRAIVTKLQSEVATYQARLHEVETQASLDPLTGLDNRRGIERRLEERIRRGCLFSIILLDLNHFKEINDTHGHIAGDELLKQFASEMRSRFRPVDGAGRWGGDEFLVVFEGSAEQASTAVRKASEWLFGDYRLKSARVQLTASVGVAQWNGSETISDTLKRADAAMYLQKNARQKNARQKHARLTA
jgi:diguanylate cyclase (GGDEF)-like protein